MPIDVIPWAFGIAIACFSAIAIMNRVENAKRHKRQQLEKEDAKRKADEILRISNEQHNARQLELIRLTQERKRMLVSKYGEEDARRILEGKVWIGMSEQQAREVMGAPNELETHVQKTQTKRVLVYGVTKETADVLTFIDNKLTRIIDRPHQ